MEANHIFGLILVIGFVQGYPSLGEETPVYVDEIEPTNGERITGGWEAREGQIPFQISLRMIAANGGVFSCGGSIIHPEWTITAAHCLANCQSPITKVLSYFGDGQLCVRLTYVVRLGAQNLTQPTIITEETIENRVMHPLYDEGLGVVQPDDIALLKLSRSIPWGPTIQPIRLQNSRDKNKDYTGVFFTVSGYGLTNDRVLGGTSSEVLMMVNLRGISNALCRTFYSVVRDQTVCAQYYNNTIQSSCSGDSGGPLTVVDEDGQLTMVGIVSFGSTRGCTLGLPSGYVRPGHYQDWIRENTGIDFDWDSTDTAHELPGSEINIVE